MSEELTDDRRARVAKMARRMREDVAAGRSLVWLAHTLAYLAQDKQDRSLDLLLAEVATLRNELRRTTTEDGKALDLGFDGFLLCVLEVGSALSATLVEESNLIPLKGFLEANVTAHRVLAYIEECAAVWPHELAQGTRLPLEEVTEVLNYLVGHQLTEARTPHDRQDAFYITTSYGRRALGAFKA